MSKQHKEDMIYSKGASTTTTTTTNEVRKSIQDMKIKLIEKRVLLNNNNNNNWNAAWNELSQIKTQQKGILKVNPEKVKNLGYKANKKNKAI